MNYVASKAGLIGLTKSLAQEMGSRNITVNAVSPGFVETDMTASLSDQLRENLLAHIPLKRMGKVEDIAAAVRFLASEEAGYITGHVLSVNGGTADVGCESRASCDIGHRPEYRNRSSDLF